MINRLLILLIGIAFVGCEAEQRESDADKYLKKVRSIYRPLAENHILIISEIYSAYENYHKNNVTCDDATIKNLWKLRERQSQLILNAKEQLDTIPDDIYGFVQSIRPLTQKHIYGVSPCWELMTLNLSYVSPKEQIVFIGSYSDNKPIFDTLLISDNIKIDTTEHFGFTENTTVINKVGREGFMGLSIKDYILHLIEPLEKLEFWDAAYRVDNEFSLSKGLIKKEGMDLTSIYEIKDSLEENK